MISSLCNQTFTW